MKLCRFQKNIILQKPLLQSTTVFHGSIWCLWRVRQEHKTVSEPVPMSQLINSQTLKPICLWELQTVLLWNQKAFDSPFRNCLNSVCSIFTGLHAADFTWGNFPQFTVYNRWGTLCLSELQNLIILLSLHSTARPSDCSLVLHFILLCLSQKRLRDSDGNVTLEWIPFLNVYESSPVFLWSLYTHERNHVRKPLEIPGTKNTAQKDFYKQFALCHDDQKINSRNTQLTLQRNSAGFQQKVWGVANVKSGSILTQNDPALGWMRGQCTVYLNSHVSIIPLCIFPYP